jgi:hypothetical protein
MLISEKNRQPVRRVLAIMLGAAASVILSMAFPFLPARSDFRAYYWAGTMVRQGRGEILYDLNQGQGYFDRPYCHLPYEALIFAPLSKLPIPTAYHVWIAVQLTAFFWSLYLLRECLANLSWLRRVALGSSVLCPLLWAVVAGQDCILLLLVYVFVFRSLKNHREFRAGVWMGLGLFRFQLLLPAILIALVKRRGELVKGLMLTASIVGVISFALVGPDLPRRYAGILSFMAHKDDAPLLRWMPTLRGLNSLVGVPPVATLLLTLAVVVVLTGAWLGTDWDPRTREFESLFALTIIVSILISYHSYLYDLVLLALPAALILRRSTWLTVAVVATYLPASIAVWGSGNFGVLALVSALLLALEWPTQERLRRVATGRYVSV